MAKVKELNVKITYRVGLGDLNIPKKVKEQLIEACEKNEEINLQSIKYGEAEEWLSDNIKEGDCFDWTAEIEDIE